MTPEDRTHLAATHDATVRIEAQLGMLMDLPPRVRALERFRVWVQTGVAAAVAGVGLLMGLPFNPDV